MSLYSPNFVPLVHPAIGVVLRLALHYGRLEEQIRNYSLRARCMKVFTPAFSISAFRDSSPDVISTCSALAPMVTDALATLWTE